jgi:3-polyprenyl-4-hydroxybenzoate decarboxylase
MIFRHLRDNLGLPVKDVHLPESGGATGLLLISLAKQNHSQPLKAMWGAWSLHDVFGKLTVVVDADVDVRDAFQVEWALSFHMQPASDVRVYTDTDALTLDPSQADYSVANESPLRRRSSKVGIDATRKHTYPPLAVPPAELRLSQPEAHDGAHRPRSGRPDGRLQRRAGVARRRPLALQARRAPSGVPHDVRCRPLQRDRGSLAGRAGVLLRRAWP